MPPAELDDLARDIARVSWLEGDFVLRSGRRSTHYLDKYLFETQPAILRRVGAALARMIPEGTQRLAAPELGAVLLGAAVSLELNLPLILVRSKRKEHGTAKALEGALEAGERVTVIEDVLTTGGAAIDAIEKVRAAGGEVIKLVGVLDREEGAAGNLEKIGVPFEALLRRGDLPAAGSA